MKIAHRHWQAYVAAWLVLFAVAQASAATPKEVEASIANLKTYLYAQFQNGNWEAAGVACWAAPKENLKQNPTGATALVTYALLAAGEKPTEPHIAQALNYLLNTPCGGTYGVGIRCLVWSSLPEEMQRKPEYQKVIQREGKLLMDGGHPDAAIKEGPNIFYAYFVPNVGGYFDHSNSQYGVLGVWAAQQCGFETPAKYWQAIDNGWRQHQFANGAWWYAGLTGNQNKNPGGPTGTGNDSLPCAAMTAAGIATLFLCDDYLHANDSLECTGNRIDANIEAGLKWMSENYKTVYQGLPCYNLYGVERIGMASGLKYIGTIDWFKEGAAYILKGQSAGGAVGDGSVESAFALVFLVRGRAPVVLNKLQYEINMHGDKPKLANWNERPRDASNVVHWMTKQLEQPWLNWQVVNLKVPVSDLHDAPILYIAGNQSLDFTDEEINKLRQFVEEGGLIYANADCESNAFSNAIKKVCRKLFPAYEFRDLPKNSPIYVGQQYSRAKWHANPRVDALSNGARELVLLVSSRDPSRFWQTSTYAGHEECYQLLDDIFLYTVARGENRGYGLLSKGDTYIVTPDASVTATKTIKIARLQYGGNWDPEPGSWRRLSAIMHNTQTTDLDVQPIQLGEGKLDNSYAVAHLTGPFKFSLPQSQRAEIAKYVEGGGTLIIDSCGGAAEFAESAQKELAAIFPDGKLAEQPVGLDSPVYAAGPKLDQVEYRLTARKVVGTLNRPRIRIMEIKGRPAVFFSAEDLTCGMVGMPVDGIYGYQPESATALMQKLVLFAACNK